MPDQKLKTWPAPAKLNLMLHVVGRRADGYHLLQTVFQLLDFGDELSFMPTDDNEVARDGDLEDVPESDDLSLRAARLLKTRSGYPGGVRIRTEKRIPVAAGLGGGSSDAATTLVALNHIWGIGYDRSRLAQIGLELGADVPVFVQGRSAWAEGIGEVLTPIELPGRWYLIIVPDCAVATRDVFDAPELTRNTPPTTIRGFLATGGRNDCEPVVRRRYPPVVAALDWLGASAPARLTGTGAAVFAAFGRSADARRILATCPDGMRAFVARGVNVSPLETRLAGARPR
jgi:4-diphosphocytidyl-2-C-methyl-D-erythritol kinase